MSLYIRNEETDRLARELAAQTGESITEVVTAALREKLDRRAADIERRIAAIRELQRLSALNPILDPRDPDDILYDEDGLPK